MITAERAASADRRVLLVKRRLIEPDQYARSPALASTWQSESIDREEWGKLRRASPAAPASASAPSATVPEA